MQIKNTNIYPLKKAVKGDYVVGTDSENFGRTVNFEVEQFLGGDNVGVSEGVDILSTGETGGFRFLGENGDGTSSWKTLTGGGDALTSGSLDQFAATTLDQLNSILNIDVIGSSDSRLSDARAPLSHGHNVGDILGAGNAIQELPLSQFAATTLEELNEVINDATIIDPSDARLSDARPPLSHTHLSSEIIGLDVLPLASTIVSSSNAVASQAGGMNDIDSVSDIVITLRDFATGAIPVGSTIMFQQINSGNVSVAYSGGASGDSGQTYRNGDVITLWHKSEDNWKVLNNPNTLDSDLTGEPSGSDIVINVVSLTQAEYDAGSPVSTTLYNIVG